MILTFGKFTHTHQMFRPGFETQRSKTETETRLWGHKTETRLLKNVSRDVSMSPTTNEITNKYYLTSDKLCTMSVSCNEPEFYRINVDFKEFKLNNASFCFIIRAEPE